MKLLLVVKSISTTLTKQKKTKLFNQTYPAKFMKQNQTNPNNFTQTNHTYETKLTQSNFSNQIYQPTFFESAEILFFVFNFLSSDFPPWYLHLHIQFVPEFMDAPQRYMKTSF